MKKVGEAGAEAKMQKSKVNSHRLIDRRFGSAKSISMKGDEIILALAIGKAVLQARRVQHLALLGSYARGDADADSDLDVLIDIDPSQPKFSLVDLAGIASLLTDITGVDTHPIERKMLAKDPRFARRIADDIIEIF